MKYPVEVVVRVVLTLFWFLLSTSGQDIYLHPLHAL